MVFPQKTKYGKKSLYFSNRREFERRSVIHFAKETTKRFREFFEFVRYFVWHLRDYLKYSAIAAKDLVGSGLDFRKLLKHK